MGRNTRTLQVEGVIEVVWMVHDTAPVLQRSGILCFVVGRGPLPGPYWILVGSCPED